jgi:hypothetical protein
VKKKRKHKSGAQKRKLKKMPEGLVDRQETDLEAMRWVSTHKTDETVNQWLMRQSLLRDPDKFLDRKMALEKAATPSPAPSGASSESSASTTGMPAAPQALDLGTERCLELARGLLEKYGVKP